MVAFPFSFLLAVGAFVFVIFVILPLMSVMTRRVVVPTNYVHIVQSGRKTISYGSGLPAGNVYYKWPATMPLIGVTVTDLPVSVFDLSLKDYNGYDVGRVPFLLDLMGFFRIDDTNLAAARVASFAELRAQLLGIVQGAARTILATAEIETILQDRSIFGDKFTAEVTEQLKQWGVHPVKNIELMDIRDAQGSKVIENIMSKKKSLIESQSRQAIAQNNQTASIAEINAAREVAMQKQEADQTVGVRTAEKDQIIGIRQQQSAQAVKEQEAITAQKTVDANKVAAVGAAEIEKAAKIVEADQAKQVNITIAEGDKQQAILAAEGAMEALKRNAEGVQAQGLAKAAAETAINLAPVTAQVTLAKEIGQNDGYQHYLIAIKQVEASRDVGLEQAKALEKAEVKVIANSSSPSAGLTGVMDIFSPKGAMTVGAALDTFANTDVGKAVISRVTGGDGAKPNGAHA